LLASLAKWWNPVEFHDYSIATLLERRDEIVAPICDMNCHGIMQRPAVIRRKVAREG
jgi:hypothetical protein